jgi:hypothetical protein
MKDRDGYRREFEPGRGRYPRGRYYPTYNKPYRTPMTRGERIARWLIAALVDIFGLLFLLGVTDGGMTPEKWVAMIVCAIVMFVFPCGAYIDIKYSYDVGEAERARIERGLP